jgi:hypothetical protein
MKSAMLLLVVAQLFYELSRLPRFAPATYARAIAAVPLLQQWLYSLRCLSDLETFAAALHSLGNASCSYAPAVRQYKPRFGHKKQPTKPAPKV